MAKPKSRKQYIEAPSPLETELTTLFDTNEPLVIFDIGSCEGEDAIRYSRLFPYAQIYAIEPLPLNIERMTAHFQQYAVMNVEIIPAALSDQAGKATFYVSSGQREEHIQGMDWDYGNKSSSLLPPAETMSTIFPWLNFEETLEVETDTFKNVCAKRNITNIDYIHMDVQGAEYQVIRGFEDLLHSVSLIWLEVSATAQYKDQVLREQIEEFMAQNGFQKVKDTVGKLSGDQLYINKRKLGNQFPIHRVLYLQMRATLIAWTNQMRHFLWQIRK